MSAPNLSAAPAGVANQLGVTAAAPCVRGPCPGTPLSAVRICMSIAQGTALKITTGCVGPLATSDCDVTWNDGMTRTWTTGGRARADVVFDRHLPAGSFLKLDLCPDGECNLSGDAVCGASILRRFEVDGAQYKDMLQSLTVLDPPGVLGCLSVQCTAAGIASECCVDPADIDLDDLKTGTEIIFGPLGDVLPIVATATPLAPVLFQFGATFGSTGATGFFTAAGSSAAISPTIESFYIMPLDVELESITIGYIGGVTGDAFTAQMLSGGIPSGPPLPITATGTAGSSIIPFPATLIPGTRIAMRLESYVTTGALSVSITITGRTPVV